MLEILVTLQLMELENAQLVSCLLYTLSCDCFECLLILICSSYLKFLVVTVTFNIFSAH